MDKFFAIHQVCQSRGLSRSTVLHHEAVEKGYRLSATAEPLFVIQERTEYLEGTFADAPAISSAAGHLRVLGLVVPIEG